MKKMADDRIILYIHGMGGGGDSRIPSILKDCLADALPAGFPCKVQVVVRTYDFDPEIFFGWGIPAYHAVSADALKGIPEGKQFRRWRQCSHELNYNSNNLQAIGAEVPGADMSQEQWNNADDVWTIPVWWDSDQE